MKTNSLPTDYELVESYRHGDDSAFSVILCRYKNSVYSYINFLTGGNYSLTEEIFQETFIRLVIAIRDNQYEEHGKLGAWLCSAAYRLMIDNYRKEQTMRIDLVQDFFDLTFAEQVDDSIEDKMVREQIIKDAVNLIDYLPVDQQKVLRMRIFENLPFKDIAERTNVSINTALGRMRYAVLNMRRLADEHHIWAKC